jgi:hypothetical protein
MLICPPIVRSFAFTLDVVKRDLAPFGLAGEGTVDPVDLQAASHRIERDVEAARHADLEVAVGVGVLVAGPGILRLDLHVASGLVERDLTVGVQESRYVMLIADPPVPSIFTPPPVSRIERQLAACGDLEFTRPGCFGGRRACRKRRRRRTRAAKSCAVFIEDPPSEILFELREPDDQRLVPGADRSRMASRIWGR